MTLSLPLVPRLKRLVSVGCRGGQRTLSFLAGAGLLALTMLVQAPMPGQAATTLYSDDFESDAIGAPPAGWNIVSGTWSVAMDGTHVMKETDTNTASAKSINTGSAAWTDYALQAQVKPGTTANGTSNVLAARYTDDSNSYALILKDGTSWYFGKKVKGVWTTFVSGALSYNTSTWYRLEIDVVGTTLSAFINGTKMASATDSTFSSGAIDVMSRYLMEVDNVTVTALGSPPPSPRPSPNPTPSPSPSPNPTPSPSPSPSPTPSPNPSPNPTPSPSPSSSPAAISGVVSDAGTGAPIAGALVATQPASTTATTDTGGAYTLNLSVGTYNVVFTAPGYNANFEGAVNAPAGGTATANRALVPIPGKTAEDLFSRPDQSGLGTASDGHTWTNDLNVYPTGKASIVGGQAFIQTATALTDHDTWMGTQYRDEEIAADLDMVNVVQDPSFQHGGRLLARVEGSDSWIVLALNPSNSTLTIWIDNSSNWAQIGGMSMRLLTNTWYHAKVDVIASNVYGKAWAFGSAEPGWQVSATQSAITRSGVGGLRCGAADVYFANYTETPITQISGTVTNAGTGTGLAGVTVSLSNGATATTGASGNYVFGALTAGTYTVSAAPPSYNPGSVNATVATGLSATGINLALT